MRVMRLQSNADQGQITGKIAKAHLAGWWIIEDSQGHYYRAASMELWRKGDQVVIQGDQIIGRAGKVPEPSVYEV